jgi:hypothetical protein
MSKDLRAGLAFLLILIGIFLLGGGFVSCMAEGPHGPHQEITADPASPYTFLIFLGMSFLAFFLAKQILSLNPQKEESDNDANPKQN